MLTTAFLGAALAMVTSVFNWLPYSNYNPLPSNFTDLLTDLSAMIWSFNYILPINVMFNIVAIWFIVQVAMAGLNLILLMLRWTRILKI